MLGGALRRRAYGASGLIVVIARMCLSMRTIMMTADIDKAKVIREQNDRVRQGDTSIPARVFCTDGVTRLVQDEDGGVAFGALFEVVKAFDQFDENNDPYAEHDFGAFEFMGERLFWKFDYYTPDLKGGSPDPSDLKQTVRVLTIMLACEY